MDRVHVGPIFGTSEENRVHVGPIFGTSEETFLLGCLLNKFGLIRVGLEVFWRPIFSLVVAGLCIGPKAHCLTWEFYPYSINFTLK